MAHELVCGAGASFDPAVCLGDNGVLGEAAIAGKAGSRRRGDAVMELAIAVERGQLGHRLRWCGVVWGWGG